MGKGLWDTIHVNTEYSRGTLMTTMAMTTKTRGQTNRKDRTGQDSVVCVSAV